jgi:hypothetical protein
MADVLRSVGVSLTNVDDGLLPALFAMSRFRERCKAALTPVSRDLETTRPGTQLDLCVVNADLGQPIAVGVTVAGFGVPAGSDLSPDMDDESLRLAAASSVGETLLVALGSPWPRCPDHGGRLVGRRRTPPTDRTGAKVAPIWVCERAERHAQHVVAEIGRLELANHSGNPVEPST